MTRPKRPLPTLRFVIRDNGKLLFRLIPITTPKGFVIPDLWAVPGCKTRRTDELMALCKKRGWRGSIEGES